MDPNGGFGKMRQTALYETACLEVCHLLMVGKHFGATAEFSGLS